MKILPSTSLNNTITVLHLFSGDLWAGAEVMVYNLLNKLKEYPNFKVIALSLNEGVLAERLRGVGIETHVIPEANNSFIKILLKAFNLLKKRRIDVIHSHRYKENTLALLLAKTTGVKRVVATIHGLSGPSIMKPSTSAYVKNGDKPLGLKTKIDYYILNNYFTHIVAVSQEIKKTLIKNYRFIEDKIDVIYNGIPLPQNLKLNLKSNGTFHIGTVGRMVQVKDLNLFLEIAAEIKNQATNVCFTILGDGPLKDKLIQKAEDLKIQNHVEFLSPRPDPFSYYQSLDLYLNTSIHEGIPLSILEAMACGKPVVAPKVGGIPEIISHEVEGYLVEGRTPILFSALCNELINDKWKRDEMGKKGIEKIRSQFTDIKMANQYHNLYLNMNGMSV